MIIKQIKQKFNGLKNPAGNENGSALIFAILILAVLTIIGISSNKTSTVEVKIASNDKVYKQSFYEADGGTEFGRELLEQNIACATGFPNDDFYIGAAAPFLKVNGQAFYLNTVEPDQDYPAEGNAPNLETRWDFYYPDNDDTDNTENFNLPHTKIKTFGNTELSSGNALQMVAGYEGKGKSAAGGGAKIIYDLYSRHVGNQNSRVTIMINYRHVIGQEGNCSY